MKKLYIFIVCCHIVYTDIQADLLNNFLMCTAFITMYVYGYANGKDSGIKETVSILQNSLISLKPKTFLSASHSQQLNSSISSLGNVIIAANNSSVSTVDFPSFNPFPSLFNKKKVKKEINKLLKPYIFNMDPLQYASAPFIETEALSNQQNIPETLPAYFTNSEEYTKGYQKGRLEEYTKGYQKGRLETIIFFKNILTKNTNCNTKNINLTNGQREKYKIFNSSINNVKIGNGASLYLDTNIPLKELPSIRLGNGASITINLLNPTAETINQSIQELLNQYE